MKVYFQERTVTVMKLLKCKERKACQGKYACGKYDYETDSERKIISFCRACADYERLESANPKRGTLL